MRRIALLILAAAACGGSRAPDPTGAAAIALSEVPADVGCLQLTIASASRTFQRMYTLTASGAQTIHASSLPTGQVSAAANAYALPQQGGCGIIGPQTAASWVSEPASATLLPGIEAAIKLVMRPNGRAGVTVDFDGDEVEVGTLVGPPGDAKPPVPDVGAGAISGGFEVRGPNGAGLRAVLADSAQHVLWMYDEGGGKTAPSVTRLGGTLGKPGYADGPLQGSAFDDPEGGTTSLRPIWNPPNSGGFVADTGNCAVREVDLDGTGGGMVTTIGPHGCGGGPIDGPPGVASLAGPRGIETVVFAGTQSILISDGHAIRALNVDAASGKMTKIATVAGDAATPGENDDAGSGLAARFNKPRGLAWDGAQTVYIADEGNHAIRALDLATGGVRTVIGQLGFAGHADGAANDALLDSPRGVAVDAMGSLIITQGNGVLRRLQGGVLVTLAGVPGKVGHADGSGSSATFSSLAQGFSVAGSFQCNFRVGDGARLRQITY